MSTSIQVENTTSSTNPSDEFAQWLIRFGEMVNTRDGGAVDDLFADGGGWRDLLAMTWDLQTAVGLDTLRKFVVSTITTAQIAEIGPSDLQPAILDSTGPAPIIEGAFAFRTESTVSQGYARLTQAHDGTWKAWTVFTELIELEGQKSNATKWEAMDDPKWHSSTEGNLSWTDARDPSRPFPSTTPTVLIVGGGQAGLQTAAHFENLGIDYVLIEKAKRLGNSWRSRHYNLTTNTPSFADHFSYLPFPASWPVSVPKDKVANWIESYAEALDLDVWTEHEALDAQYLEDEGRWRARVRRPSGEVVVVKPKHLIFASGFFGAAKDLTFPNAKAFSGTVFNSSQYTSGHAWKGKKAVIVGAGSTAHDIAKDLVEQGCTDVTMIQRSPTHIISFQKGVRMAYEANFGPVGEVDLEIADLKYKSTPLPILLDLTDEFTKHVTSDLVDGELLSKLRESGFRVSTDGLLRRSLTPPALGGYYINQGASELIIEGRVKVVAGGVVDLYSDGVVLADGTRIEADLVVTCAGFHTTVDILRPVIGDEIADQLSASWVLDHVKRGGEHGVVFGESGIPNMWLAAGGMHQTRLYSSYLALKIAALERNLVTSVGAP
jgi:putative flavoprotein involved in K+ transport